MAGGLTVTHRTLRRLIGTFDEGSGMGRCSRSVRVVRPPRSVLNTPTTPTITTILTLTQSCTSRLPSSRLLLPLPRPARRRKMRSWRRGCENERSGRRPKPKPKPHLDRLPHPPLLFPLRLLASFLPDRYPPRRHTRSQSTAGPCEWTPTPPGGWQRLTWLLLPLRRRRRSGKPEGDRRTLRSRTGGLTTDGRLNLYVFRMIARYTRLTDSSLAGFSRSPLPTLSGSRRGLRRRTPGPRTTVGRTPPTSSPLPVAPTPGRTSGAASQTQMNSPDLPTRTRSTRSSTTDTRTRTTSKRSSLEV